MKTYELTQDWQGVLKGTKLYGPFQIMASSGYGYCIQENIPADGQPTSNAFFASAVETNPTVFQEVT